MGYKAMLFDLDDTLLNRDMAVDTLFFICFRKNVMKMLVIQLKTICYGNLKNMIKGNTA